MHGSKAVQYIEYDSFGNVIACANSGFRFPLGFAGGLHDPFTGFVRFGYRDYDPVVGRFTAKDPLGDTGGDHDLWDYCVDDPVSMIDPKGLDGFAVLHQFAQQPGLQHALRQSTESWEDKEKAREASKTLATKALDESSTTARGGGLKVPPRRGHNHRMFFCLVT